MTGSPRFIDRPDHLSVNESRYFQDLLYRTIKIGTELEFALPKGVLREDFQLLIKDVLKPSRDMSRLGHWGVYDVIKEHCGIEILIIGRHPHWDSLTNQYSRIVLPLLKQEIRMRPTCGLHFHLLGIGLAENIPEIILANLWNMARAYAPALKFMTSGGDCMTGMCRRRQHNAHYEFLRNSPVLYSMREIQARLKASLEVPEHQNFFNVEHVRFSEDGSISDFHIELRFPDGDLCPISITAKTFLFLAMLLKAVEISKFGLMDVDSAPDWPRKQELMDLISNNDGMHATSETSGVVSSAIEEFRANSIALLRFLKSIFLILDNPCEQVLLELAKRPISLRRAGGQDWLEINAGLAALVRPAREMDELDYELIKIIELGLLSEHREDAWYRRAAKRLGCSERELLRRMEFHGNRNPVWSREVGSVVFSR